jgi:hypothetical protein
MKRLQAALLVTGLAFLVYLIWSVGALELLRQLRMLGWGVLPLILSEGLANLAHTIGWRHCLCGSRRFMSLSLLFRMASAGYAINFLTPSATLGGEVAKGALLASHQRGPEATSSVLIDKLSSALAHLVLVALGSVFIFWKVSLPWALWAGLLVSNLLIGGGVLAFLCLQKQGKLGWVIRWLAARRLKNRTLQKMALDFTSVDDLIKDFHKTRPMDMVLAVGWHIVGHSVAIFQTWLFLYLLNRTGSLVNVATAGVLCSWFDFATFAIPFNLGTLEGSRIVALKAVGCSAVVGMTYGIAQRIAQLSWAGFGLLNYVFLVRRGAEKTAAWPGTRLGAGL